MKKTVWFSVLLFLNGSIFSQKTISEHIDKLGNKYVKSRKNHGLVIGIIRGDDSVVKSFGKISKADKSAPNGNSVFEIGATTSVFTTSLMQIQAIKNRFQQHDPVHLYLEKNRIIPAFHPLKCVDVNINFDIQDNSNGGQQRIFQCFEDPTAKPKCITFCNLATHIAGLPHSPKGWYKWKHIGNNRLKNSFQDFTVEKFFTRLQGVQLDYVPGTKYIHSDFGIALLGNAMSEISGLSYEALLTKELLQPLGMGNTQLSFSEENKLKILPGHNRKGKPVSAWNFDAMAPAAGLKSTANDLMKFVEANLNPSNQEFENAFAEVHQNKVNVFFGKNGRMTSMGYGWYTSTLNEKSNLPVIWINGGTGGFRSFIGFIKDMNTAVVVLSNSANSVDKIGFDILEILNAEIEVSKEITTNKD